MNKVFQVAGIQFSSDDNIHQWNEFQVKEADDIQFTISCLHLNMQRYGLEQYPNARQATTVFRNKGEVMFVDSDWKNVLILPPQSIEQAEAFFVQVFHTHAVRRQMIQLHCATIDDDGRGILFLGPSGIGKTTQAERWAQYRGSAIINGDIGFVQRTPAGYTAWGTPWHGSSPYCLNASVPVKALVVLKQAPQNALRKLTGFEKVREVSGSVFYPTWLEDGMELCTDTLNHLLSDLPVYRLDNRADGEAVRLLAAEIDRIS